MQTIYMWEHVKWAYMYGQLITNHCFNRWKAIILTTCLLKILSEWKSLQVQEVAGHAWGQKQIIPFPYQSKWSFTLTGL